MLPIETAVPVVVLTIAGSDSSAGAGIQADLKAFAACGVYGTSVVTALTAQNTLGILGVVETPADFVGTQIDAIASDFRVGATKTGMLGSAGIIEVVAAKVHEHRLQPLVVDPVMQASSGATLLAPDGVRALTRQLLPLATVATPNVPEAEALTGRRVTSVRAMREAARAIHGLGADAVVVKGGHLTEAAEAVDILFDGRDFHEFRGRRIETQHTHGSGCTFAAALAANLACGLSLVEAVSKAKELVTIALRNALALGRGSGPVNALAALCPEPPD